LSHVPGLDLVVLGFGGFFCLIWAIGLLIQPNKTKWVPAFFVGSSGIRLLWESCTHTGFSFQYPISYGLTIPFLYSIGPTIFLYYEELNGRKKETFSWIHWIPLFISLLPLIFWVSLGFEEQQRSIQEILSGNWELPYGVFILWIIGPKVSILVYALLIGVSQSGAGALAIQLLPERIRFFAILLLIYIFGMISADIIGYIFGIKTLYKTSAWSHSFAAIFVYLYAKRNPNILLDIAGAIQSARYSKSKLTRVNSNQALSQLDQLLTKESYYADEDMRLQTLAEALKMSPHQLSELVNVNLQMSFIQYVNSHRILIACKMLEEEDRNILSVAYAVGFNSKSAFNRVFRQLVGTSPREFRKSPNKFLKSKSNLKSKLNPKL